VHLYAGLDALSVMFVPPPVRVSFCALLCVCAGQRGQPSAKGLLALRQAALGLPRLDTRCNESSGTMRRGRCRCALVFRCHARAVRGMGGRGGWAVALLLRCERPGDEGPATVGWCTCAFFSPPLTRAPHAPPPPAYSPTPPPPWPVSLRHRLPPPPRAAHLVHIVQSVCSNISLHLKACLSWQARVRDALCGHPGLRRASPADLFSLISEGRTLLVRGVRPRVFGSTPSRRAPLPRAVHHAPPHLAPPYHATLFTTPRAPPPLFTTLRPATPSPSLPATAWGLCSPGPRRSLGGHTLA
jgi:hypothetical protein